MRNAELWSSGQVVIIQKFNARIYLYAAKAAGVFFYFLQMQGTFLTVPITYRLDVVLRNSQDCSLHFKNKRYQYIKIRSADKPFQTTRNITNSERSDH